MEAAAVELTRLLVRSPSVTPADAGCQALLMERLQRAGFVIHALQFGEIHNFYAVLGSGGRNLCLAGHTDVVPPGEPSHWQVDPFAGAIAGEALIGRGVCDMKGGLAAMVVAVEELLRRHPAGVPGRISLLVTGDEEGDGINGTVKVLEWLAARGERIDYCIVGEPTARDRVGDCLKVGRRGSLNGRLTVRGIQGHVAYPDLARNPIHEALGVLGTIAAWELDRGTDQFEPSRLQFTTLHSGGLAVNVIPGELSAGFNIRFNPLHTPQSLETTLRGMLDAAGSDYTLETSCSALPFIAPPGGELLAVVQAAIRERLGITPELSTSGGTSDARFIVRHCPQVIELGLRAETIHKVNEQSPLKDLGELAALYLEILERLERR